MCQANPVAALQVPTTASARACADGQRVNSISVTRMNSRANAARLCSKAIMLANALDEIAKPGSFEATCIGICCRAVWLHTAVMQRVLRLSARARFGAVRPAAIAVARQLMPCADAVANARAVSEEASVWQGAQLRRLARLRLHRRRHGQKAIVCMP